MTRQGQEGTLRTLRRKIPLTLQAAAKRAGISYQYLSDIERHKVLPSPYAAARIADTLGASFEHVWGAICEEYEGAR